MLYVVNYANKKFEKSRKLNSKTAKEVGKADAIFSYNDKDIDSDFYIKNKNVFNQPRGNGYWLWKPYFIQKALKLINNGDFLMYCDSGAYFINDIHLLVDKMIKDNQDIMCFQISTIEKQYSKRDAFILMNCDEKRYYDSNQICATFSIYRKSNKSVKFVNEWLKYAQDERIITDISNKCGKQNYAGFIENRHDQTVFSLLCKKNNIMPYRDISQYGNDVKMSNSSYPQIVELHRIRIASSIFQVKFYRIILPILLPIYKKIFHKKS